MKWIKRLMLLAGIGIFSIGAIPSMSYAKQVDSIDGHPIFDNRFEGIEIRDGSGEEKVTRIGNVLATTYDPRESGAVSAVEDQGQTNTCWAFSTIAAMESNLIKKGYETSAVNLSENHLAYFYFNRQKDPLGLTAGDANYYLPGIAGQRWYQYGGTLFGTAYSVATWSGVVRETISEDDALGYYLPYDQAVNTAYNRDYVVKNVYFYNYDVSTIKQAIVEHGAVASSIYVGDAAYSDPSKKAYYYPYEEANHGVVIVGWADDFPKENFREGMQPKKDGAWIVKNSWGVGEGENGYIYVSYEDASMKELVAYDMASAAELNQNNYQYDGTGNPAYSRRFPSGSSVANVFQAKAAGGCNEILEAVSINTNTTNVYYSLQVYTGVTSSKNPTKGKAMFSTVQRGVLSNAGYNRIELQQPVTLQAGEKYSVVLTLTAADGGSVDVGIEREYRQAFGDGVILFQTDVDKKVGFAKTASSGWYDMGSSSGGDAVCNLRIKAFTRNTAEKTTYKLSSKSTGISKGSSQKLSLVITPATIKRKVTWTSSNNKVATVSSSGKVTAKAYGTTTIKAKFVSGKKTKTLSCKVTVGPSKVKGLKVKGAKKKITVSWKKSSGAAGYEISYSTSPDGKYKKLGTVKSGSTTKFTKKKMKPGTYYVKVRPYMTQSGNVLYGSYTAAKQVVVK